MAEIEPIQSAEELKARVAAAMRRSREAGFERDDKQRRKHELKQARGRVNHALLTGADGPPREPFTVRVRPDLRKQITKLAERLSAPRAQVYVADLVEEGILHVLGKHLNPVGDEKAIDDHA